MFYFGGVHLSLDVLRMCGFKAPFRISSTPKGSVMPTALYVLVEDVVAVDGGGGQIYRYALRTRYLSSPYFRRMLFEMNCFWGGGSIVCAAAITAIIFTVSEPVAYTVSPPHPKTLAASQERTRRELTDLRSWAGASRSHGLRSGPSLPSHGSRAISVVKGKLGKLVAFVEVSRTLMISTPRPLVLDSNPSRPISISCPGLGRNNHHRLHHPTVVLQKMEL